MTTNQSPSAELAAIIARLRAHDDANSINYDMIDTRDLLCMTDDDTLTLPDADDDFTPELAPIIADFRRMLDMIRDDDIYCLREQLTELALSLSLCPLHLHDYAICFDDAICFADTPDDPANYTRECAAIRTIHPSHDT